MRNVAFEPCIPTRGAKVPAGPDWIHENKHDGYRLIVHRDGARVRLFTRNGNDWTKRYPLIVEAALRNRQTSFVLDGEDLRKLPLHLRKNNLARLLARRPEGIFVSEFEQGEIGPDLFRQACKFGLEGLVSKRRESVYRGRSPNSIKVKNRSHPALDRVKESFS